MLSLRAEELQKPQKTHKAQNKTKHIKTLNEHTCTQANTFIPEKKNNLYQMTTRIRIYATVTPLKMNYATNHQTQIYTKNTQR